MIIESEQIWAIWIYFKFSQLRAGTAESALNFTFYLVWKKNKRFCLLQFGILLKLKGIYYESVMLENDSIQFVKVIAQNGCRPIWDKILYPEGE